MSKFRTQPRSAKFGNPVQPPPIVDNDRLPPVFSFEYMQDGNGFSVNCCNGERRAALTAQLFVLSRIDWLQIKKSPRHGIGSEKIAREALKPAVPARVPQDAQFLALRYHGKNPMIGFRDGRIFNIVFLDHAFAAYDH